MIDNGNDLKSDFNIKVTEVCRKGIKNPRMAF